MSIGAITTYLPPVQSIVGGSRATQITSGAQKAISAGSDIPQTTIGNYSLPSFNYNIQTPKI